MRIKLLFILAVILVALILIVRLQFRTKISVFKTNLSKYENELANDFIVQKDKRLRILQSENAAISELFNEQFSFDQACQIKDTIFRYLYLKKKLSYIRPASSYIDCLTYKCQMDYENDLNQQKIESKKMSLAKKYGDSFIFWYDKFKEDKLIVTEEVSTSCTEFFKDLIIQKWDEEKWKAIESFLKDYESNLAKIEAKNNLPEIEFNRARAITRSQLNPGMHNFLDTKLDQNSSQIFPVNQEVYSYKSEALGNIHYTLENKSFSEEAYNHVIDEVFYEQYKDNSLKTGSMPYSVCYGSSNYCSGWGCSEIRVKNGGSDVVVIIKNHKDITIRHGYIRAGSSFTFKLPDGTYSVYFYSGRGWDPRKIITKSPCLVKGGFCTSESVTKDSYAYLNNQILEYTLTEVINGNFNPEHSSINEAF